MLTIFSWILIISTFLPLIKNQHWFFRIHDFPRFQTLVLLSILTLTFPFWGTLTPVGYLTIILLSISVIYNIVLLYRYTPLFKVNRSSPSKNASKPIHIISTNVYQDNTDYQRFIEFIFKNDPDIVLTMESDKNWEKYLNQLDTKYPRSLKVALDNTYGMHLYSKLEFLDEQIHYYVADDLPSFEVTLKTEDNFKFKLFTLHPPPPSPTEEDNSKERDGELLSAAKKIKELKDMPTVAIGDFNCVAWATASKLFTKTSGMVDPRLGRGLVSTFHAKYKLLRFPIDQIYHSSEIFVEEFKALENIGSDHLPLYFKFVIDLQNNSQEDLTLEVTQEELEEVEEIIEEGKQETGNR